MNIFANVHKPVFAAWVNTHALSRSEAEMVEAAIRGAEKVGLRVAVKERGDGSCRVASIEVMNGQASLQVIDPKLTDEGAATLVALVKEARNGL